MMVKFTLRTLTVLVSAWVFLVVSGLIFSGCGGENAARRGGESLAPTVEEKRELEAIGKSDPSSK